MINKKKKVANNKALGFGGGFILLKLEKTGKI